MEKEKRKGRCGTWLWIIIIICILGTLLGDVPDNEDSSDTLANDENTNSEEAILENSFVKDISVYIDPSIAENIQSIYLDKLGFSDVVFYEKMENLENYYIYADGYKTVATIMSDYCRIFIPNSNYVFYENGNVLLTANDFLSKQINSSDQIKYYFIAKEIIEQCLVSPETAEFPSAASVKMEKNDNLIAVQGYVDSKNSIGIEIRSNYVVQFYITDIENIFYEVQYINIEGEETGSFIAFN